MAAKCKCVNIFALVVIVFVLSLSTQTKGSNTGFVLVKPTTAQSVAPLFDSKSYLKRYCYLEHARRNLEIGASEEQILEFAIKTYQANFGISVTGKLDNATLALMTMARCGNPDIIKHRRT
ncbi:metalloendoproteinase 3-MMP-like [Salvia divinorum]|uniref:Metalloendoproteinase 3-MMP-like n=1 Tax=Salvia divinorum TaxID=28513 RepID=A0ABD1I0Y7_SALDI